MKLLFLCSQNKRRSLTAEKLFDQRGMWVAKSAGTETNARIKVTPGLIGWADIIFTMEKKHTRRIQDRYYSEIQGKKVICLYITDDYDYMDSQLIEILESEITRNLDEVKT